MQSRFLPHVSTCSIIGALALAVAGCATDVVVSPQANPDNSVVASYEWGTLSGNIKSDVASAFAATNRTLDDMKYYRVGQEVTPEKGAPMTKAKVYARGPLDVLITVEISPAKTDGLTCLSVDLDPSDGPKAQEIFSQILKNLGGNQKPTPATTPAGMSSPTRPSGS